jgi:hypothetical protein
MLADVAYVQLFETIWKDGEWRKWGKNRFKYWRHDGWDYWAMTKFLPQSKIINRARVVA